MLHSLAPTSAISHSLGHRAPTWGPPTGGSSCQRH